jgi:hypothetical protein
MKILLLLLLSLSPYAFAHDSTDCLARIAYGEARGEPKRGIIAVMHAAKTHAQRLKRHVCRIPAVQKPVPPKLRMAYRGLASDVLAGRIGDPTGGADSWRSTRWPPKIGRITAKIGHHWFAVALR